MRLHVCGVLALSVAAGMAFGQGDVVTPNLNTSTAGNGGINTFVRDSGFPRTYQQQVAASELASIPVGAQITGVQWRQQPSAANATSWPATPATWATYNVVMAQAAFPMAGMTTTFASNMVSPVTVRNTPFAIGANSYPGGVVAPPAVNGWGPMLNFTTPYVYQGGDLVIYVEHMGSNIVGNRFLDCLTTLGVGYGTTCRAISALSFAALTGTAQSYTITRFHWASGGGPTNPFGSGSLTPGCIQSSTGAASHLRVLVTPGSNPASTVLQVTANGTNIGLGTSITLFDDGNHNDGGANDNEFGADVVIPAGVTAGLQAVPFTVSDAESRFSNGNINANVVGFGAGEGLANANEPTGSGDLTTIAVAHTGSAAKMYKIAICNPANFSATTVGGATIDTQLFLFDAAGMGIAHSDDATGTLSTITNTHTTALSPGTYYLALTSYNRDPIANGCDSLSLLWINTPFNVERAPDGPAAGSPVGAWTGAGASGAVTITLTGARYAAEGCAPTCDGDVNCDFALDGFDVEVQEKAVGGDTTDFCQADPDFNGDFALDGFDVEAVEVVVGGGPCP